MSVYVCISLDASFAVLSQEGLAQQCVIFLCITLAPSHYRQGCQFMFFFLFFFFFFFFSENEISKHHTQSRNTQIVVSRRYMETNILYKLT